MYKIVIIDDEDLFLQNISDMLEWNNYNLEIAATFNNSAAALDYIHTHDVDGIFTDIKMPGVSGLELAKTIYNTHPEITLFIISAHSKFEYLHEAINYNISGYILKPLDYDDLAEAATKMCTCIEEKRLQNMFYSRTIDARETHLHNLISNYINKKADNIDKIESFFIEHNYPSNIMSFPCATVCISIIDLAEYLDEIWSHEKENLFLALNQLMSTTDQYIIPYLQTFDSIEILMLAHNESMEQFRKNIENFKRTYSNNCFEILNIALSIQVKHIYSSLPEISTFTSADNYGFKKITNAIFSGDSKLAISVFYDIRKSCGDEFLPQFIKFYSIELSNKLPEAVISNQKLSLSHEYGAEQNLLLIKKACDFFAKSNNNATATIYKVKKYIDDNYFENIRLKDLADMTFLSTSQFARNFKRTFNTTLVNYINKVRIEHACEILITTDRSANQICGDVGYTSYSYFIKKFKSETGYSVSQYRQLFGKSN